MKSKLFNQLLEQARKKRRKIGISIIRTTDEIVDSIKKGQEEVDVLVLGKKIDGVECIEMEDEKEIGIKLVQMFKNGEIDQFVRGQVDDLWLVEEFKKQFDIDPGERRVAAALMQSPQGHEFFLTAASNPDAQDLADKRRITEGAIWFMKEYFKIKPKVAVMATCRPGSYGKDPVMSQTYDEAEELVKILTEQGIEAKNVHIELEKAIEWGANLIVPARGITGNQIFRAIYYLCGGKIFCCPTIFTGKAIYEDDSRNETDWYPHLVAAAAWANSKE